VLALQAAAYPPAFHEARATFAALLALYPAGCLGIFATDEPRRRLCGYAFAHPAHCSAVPPSLHSDDHDWSSGSAHGTSALHYCFYVHDVAVDPVSRGRGLATSLLQALAGTAAHPVLMLTAVLGAARFWERFGFKLVADLDAAALARLETYPGALTPSAAVPRPVVMAAQAAAVLAALHLR